LAAELEVKKHVIFYNRFVELEELQEFLGAADIYITPYIHAAQITSGILAYAFGCGKAVMSTPYWHAQELLADGRGILVPFGDKCADLGMVESRHKISSDLSRLLFRYGIGAILFTSLKNALGEGPLPQGILESIGESYLRGGCRKRSLQFG
jgi:hypothetical protein